MAIAATYQPLLVLVLDESKIISIPGSNMGREQMGLRTALPSQANVPFQEKRTPAVVANRIGIDRRRARKYVEIPAMISKQMWNQSRPLENAKSSVRGKNPADCISPNSGWPSPS